MSKMGGYTQVVDGIGVEVPNGTIFRLACCDCGLVHDVVVLTRNRRGKIGLAMKRNKRSTTMRRKGRSLERALKDQLAASAASPAAARESLMRTGLYNLDGSLKAAHGGPRKRPSTKPLMVALEAIHDDTKPRSQEAK